MDNLGFEPAENYILAEVSDVDEDGTSAIIRAIGPNVSGHEVADRVYLHSDKFKKMTIRGIKCILFKESALIE
jgi:DNA-binding protein